ncbi:MAG: tannase/feruloyl esterase family alpha/beta hydrolase [Steroidobacteraceae bacterium]
MRHPGVSVISLVALLACCVAPAAHAAQKISCEALAKVVMPDTTATTVQEIATGTFRQQSDANATAPQGAMAAGMGGGAPGASAPAVGGPPGAGLGAPAAGGPPGGGAMTGLPKFCRYAGVIAPKINFEVWLPLENWNGRLQGGGNGGLAGSIGYSGLAEGIKQGYVTVGTDTGHAGDGTEWMNNQQQVIDYGSRAIHEMTVRAKTLIAALYDQPLKYAYFDGCSTGGGQALMNIQRYPGDYNGVVAGASNFNQTKLRAGGHIWTWYALHETPQSNMSSAQLKMLNEAVMGKCDALDGVKDGIINDPRKCSFDAAALVCKANQNGDSCLNEAQVKAANKIYAGSRNPRTGEAIWPAYQPGSETGWGVFSSDSPFGAASTFYRTAVLHDESFDFRKFNFDTDAEKAEAGYASILDATDPDLRPFQKLGGKAVIYHGYVDSMISPLASIQYYDSVVDFYAKQNGNSRTNALKEVQSFARLYMMPGVGHCGNGAGPDKIESMKLLQGWVEKGEAPTNVVASKVSNGQTTMTRPLCAYPQQAVYKGKGDTNVAASFECRAP